ncbi:hypothetical protein BJV78DRAFT_80197 [Lactifluus subvellereus]|nr:hypothetical protein BJV78DRAFT_80197 [Lactifluus subvellereus]
MTVVTTAATTPSTSTAVTVIKMTRMAKTMVATTAATATTMTTSTLCSHPCCVNCGVANNDDSGSRQHCNTWPFPWHLDFEAADNYNYDENHSTCRGHGAALSHFGTAGDVDDLHGTRAQEARVWRRAFPSLPKLGSSYCQCTNKFNDHRTRPFIVERLQIR